MENSKFSLAAVLSIMVLLVFSYITFMGLVYWRGGDMLLPLVLSLSLVAIVLLCVTVMCISKATRWKNIGNVGQYTFGFIIMVAFLSAAFPFTNFVMAIEDQQEIAKQMTATYDAALKLDDAYKTYVDGRVSGYAASLQTIAASHDATYKECLEGAAGGTDADKIKTLTANLRGKLLPKQGEEIVKARHEWLDKAREVNVWNLFTPSNVSTVDKTVKDWLDNYVELSQLAFKGDPGKPFEYPAFQASVSKVTSRYQSFSAPSPIAVIVSLACFAVMLFPWFITRRSLAAVESGSNHGGSRVGTAKYE